MDWMGQKKGQLGGRIAWIVAIRWRRKAIRTVGITLFAGPSAAVGVGAFPGVGAVCILILKHL